MLLRPLPLFKSRRILNVINTAKVFNCRPSELLGVDDEDVYAKYFEESFSLENRKLSTFNNKYDKDINYIYEACAYLYNRMQPDKDGKTKKPTFIEDIKESKTNNPGLDLLMS